MTNYEATYRENLVEAYLEETMKAYFNNGEVQNDYLVRKGFLRQAIENLLNEDMINASKSKVFKFENINNNSLFNNIDSYIELCVAATEPISEVKYSLGASLFAKELELRMVSKGGRKC